MATVNTQSIIITADILGMVAEIDEFKGAWKAVGRLAPERLSILRHVATVESVGASTRIEGSHLTDSEVEALLKRAAAPPLRSRDEQEVAGCGLLMDTILGGHASIPVDERRIRQLHALLLRYSDKDVRHRGQYKTLPNRIEAFDENGRSLGVLLETTPPFQTPRAMGELVAWLDGATASGTPHPLIRIGVFVATFLAIHPFQDGNGRLSRALTTLLLLRAGYGFVPYASLERIIEARKEEYYLALRRTQVSLNGEHTDWQPWLTFFLAALRQQKRNLEQKVEQAQIMHAPLPSLAEAMLKMIADHGSASIGELIRATNAPRATAKKWMSVLAQRGLVVRTGAGRSARYRRV